MRYILIILALLCVTLSAQDSLTVIGEIVLPPAYGNAIGFPSDFLNYKPGGDFNHDGYDDFIFSFYNSDLENSCLGVFWGGTTPWLYPDEITPNPNWYYTTMWPSWHGDLTGDGRNDMVITYMDPTDCCYAGIIKGGGEFTADTDSTFSYWYWGGFEAWNGGFDFNADGYDDILCLDKTSEFWNGNVDILFGANPMDTITDFHIEGNNSDFYMLGDVASVGDVNGDGSPDLLLTNNYFDEIYGPVFMNVYCGGEDFDTTPETTFQMPDNFYAMNNLGGLISNGDFNGDGCDDTIWIDSDSVHVLWGSEDLSFPMSSFNIANGANPNNASSCYYCNINNDQYDDIATRIRTGDCVYFYLGGESIPEEPSYAIPVDGTSSAYSAGRNLGDINGDGHNDVYVVPDEDYSRAIIYSLDPVSIDDEVIEKPETICLSNSPNPFRTSTTIHLDMPSDQLRDATIEIFNVRGQKVRSLPVDRNSAVTWDAKDVSERLVSSGVYFYRLKQDGRSLAVRKLLLVR